MVTPSGTVADCVPAVAVMVTNVVLFGEVPLQPAMIVTTVTRASAANAAFHMRRDGDDKSKYDLRFQSAARASNSPTRKTVSGVFHTGRTAIADEFSLTVTCVVAVVPFSGSVVGLKSQVRLAGRSEHAKVMEDASSSVVRTALRLAL